MRDHARILSIVATEAVEEPDTIARRPEVLDALASLSKDYDLPDVVDRISPGAMSNPAADVAWLAAALAPYRGRPLDDAPELVEKLAFLAWVLNQAVSDDQPTSDSAALTLA
jgi:hypothetical protein